MKRVIRVQVSDCADYDNFTGRLADIKTRLDLLIEKYGEDAEVEGYYETDYYGTDRYWKVNLHIDRLETDVEHRARLTKEQAHRDYSNQQDKVAYERLKKKFKQ
jgi:hypothetical protein